MPVVSPLSAQRQAQRRDELRQLTGRKGMQVRHLGPVSQDFYAAFRLGPNDTTITNLDEAGVALAAIQGLNQLVQQKDAELGRQEGELARVKRKLEAIEAKLGM